MVFFFAELKQKHLKKSSNESHDENCENLSSPKAFENFAEQLALFFR